MMMKSIKAYSMLQGFPGGKMFFSKIVCFFAPYFGTIKPRFSVLKPGYCEITMKNRRAVRNHLNSVNAIAMCCLCELAGGMAIDAALPDHLRWIPRGMKVDYLKIAKTDLRGICQVPGETVKEAGTLQLPVSVTDTSGTEVMKAVITMHITEQKIKRS